MAGIFGNRLTTSRRRGNGPAGGMRKVVSLRHELLNIQTDVPKKKEKVLKGRRTILTDDQVREARRLYECGGKTIKEICQIFHLKIGYAYRLMSYEVRSKVLR